MLTANELDRRFIAEDQVADVSLLVNCENEDKAVNERRQRRLRRLRRSSVSSYHRAGGWVTRLW